MPGTLIGVFLDSVARYRKRAQFMRKVGGRWESVSGERALGEVERFAMGLRDLGIGPGDTVALLAETRYEWAVADLAILGLGAVTVPVYPTSTPDQCRFVLENCGARVAIASTPALLEKLRAAAGALAGLQALIGMDAAPLAPPRERPWEAVLRRGAEILARDPRAFREAAARIRAVDLATIIYTSGTTGEPKGVMLSHHNIVSNIESCLQLMKLASDDLCLSFLPLNHIFERMAGFYAMMAAGATIAYAEGFAHVAANAAEVKPTVLMGVPRFYEKVMERVMHSAAAEPPLRRALFSWCLAGATAAARARLAHRPVPPFTRLRARIADRLVGARIRARIGGRMRYGISGGAPLAPSVLEFFFAIGIPVFEGYGLTETSPVVCLNRRGHEKPGTVGQPIPGTEVRIAENGEILVRGPGVMMGYLRNPEATRLALEDGWFHTGDVGHLDADGCLVITDRLKDLLVTAGGKKVAPQPIEARLKASKWIAEAVLIGDRHPYVVCLLFPSFASLEAEAPARGWPTGNHQALIEHPEVRALYQPLIDEVNASLAPFEQIKKFALLPRPLSVEAGELTAGLEKVRRRIVSQHFSDVIDQMYANPANAAPAA
jgi:long-chain acyl-CoA synthetase